MPSFNIPEWAHIPGSASGAEVEDDGQNDTDRTVTVDEFLRRSAQKPRRDYGKRKRKVINLKSAPQGFVTVALIGCWSYSFTYVIKFSS